MLTVIKSTVIKSAVNKLIATIRGTIERTFNFAMSLSRLRLACIANSLLSSYNVSWDGNSFPQNQDGRQFPSKPWIES